MTDNQTRLANRMDVHALVNVKYSLLFLKRLFTLWSI